MLTQQFFEEEPTLNYSACMGENAIVCKTMSCFLVFCKKLPRNNLTEQNLPPIECFSLVDLFPGCRRRLFRLSICQLLKEEKTKERERERERERQREREREKTPSATAVIHKTISTCIPGDQQIDARLYFSWSSLIVTSNFALH
jgi:hypothetical protein